MSRIIITQGRNSWRIVNTRRCHSIRIPGDIHPMHEPVSAWGVVSTVVWVLGTVYAVSLWLPS